MSISNPADDIVELLSAASEASFYAGLAAVDAARGAEFVIAILHRLGSAPLPDLRRSERLTAVLRKARLSVDDLRTVGRASVAAPAVLRNAVAAFLPPSERRLLAGARRQEAVVTTTRAAPEFAELAAAAGSGEGEACSTVLILSTLAQQDANIALLKDGGFSPFVYDTLDKLHADLASNTDICGCIIDRSFLSALTKDEQAQLFVLLASYSTFIWLRVDDGGLKMKIGEAESIIRKARLQTQFVATHHLSMQPTSLLRQPELGALRRASETLREYAHTVFLPGELREPERRLLVAAARDHEDQLRFDRTLRIDAIETRFVQGGHSEARVAIVRVNSAGRAVIAKIDVKEAIRNELERFRLFVQPVDDQLRPYVYFHGNAAVVFFAFIPSEDNDQVPADTLETRIQKFWFDEMCGKATEWEYENLCKALTNATNALGRINRQHPSHAHQPLGNPDISLDYIERMEARGIEWGLPMELRSARRAAEQRFARLATAAVVHGDLHLRNVLLRGDRSAHLIDFAASGPGHPALDLVRMEMALFTQCWRQVDTEDRYVELQRGLSIEGLDFKVLSDQFRVAEGPMTNRLCLHGCVAARRLAMEVLATFGGEILDYLAVKYLVAWQTLLMDHRQTNLSRAVIRAIGDAFVSGGEGAHEEAVMP